MKRSPRFLVVCTVIAYLVILPTAFLRYRLTLDVDVDGVERSGSGVVEIAYQPMPDWLVEGGPTAYSSAKCAAMRSRWI